MHALVRLSGKRPVRHISMIAEPPLMRNSYAAFAVEAVKIAQLQPIHSYV